MPRYNLTINVLEIGRTVEIIATSKREARDKVRAGAWDTEIGATDPVSYRTMVVGKVEEIK